jgi:hypothetical protein
VGFLHLSAEDLLQRSRIDSADNRNPTLLNIVIVFVLVLLIRGCLDRLLVICVPGLLTARVNKVVHTQIVFLNDHEFFSFYGLFLNIVLK